jgi:hypothetical protein
VERGPDEEVSADHLQGDLRMTWTTWAVRVSVFVDWGAIIASASSRAGVDALHERRVDGSEFEDSFRPRGIPCGACFIMDNIALHSP